MLFGTFLSFAPKNSRNKRFSYESATNSESKAQKTAKAVDALSNQTLAAMPKDAQMSLKGKNQHGIEVYETSTSVLSLSWKKRKAQYLDLMKRQYHGRTAKFLRNGHYYYAKFDPRSVRKHIWGDNRADEKGLNALINSGADGDVFDIVERSRYTGSRPNAKSNTNADYFDYFVKTVQIDGVVFDLIADVEKTYGVNGGYVYTLALTENTKIKASPARGTPNTGPVKNAGNASAFTLPQQSPKVNGQNSDRLTEPSTREILAIALEGTAKTELEKKVISEYIDTIPKLNEQEAKLNELNAQIREMSFGKGPRDTKKLNQLKTEAAESKAVQPIFDYAAATESLAKLKSDGYYKVL